jgi:hypothetical protein
MGGPMNKASYLRRQAALCLNLSRSCSDAELAEHLDLIAAEFHAQALKSEFLAEFDSDDPFDATDIENLRLLLDHSEIADMFDATARQRIGEFIGRAASRGELGVPAKRKQPDLR